MSDQPILLPYQQRWVADDSPVKVAEKSRRVGFTWGEAADDALYSASANGDDTLYIGYNRELAIEFIETVGMWAKAYALAASEIEDAGDVLEDVDKEKGIQAFRIRFASGHKAVALSSKPRSLRGRQGRVVLDEFAFHDDQKELLKAAMALLMWGGKVRIISTHDGEENEFNALVNDIRAERKKFSLHRVTFDEAIAEGLFRRICEKLQQPWSAELEAKWRAEIVSFYGDGADEELHCIPRSGGGAYIPGALIQKRMSKEFEVVRWEMPASFAEDPKPVREIECHAWLEGHVRHLLEDLNPLWRSAIGEDFARSGDLTVICPGQIRPDLVRVVPFMVELRNIPFEQQWQVVRYIIDRLPRFHAGKFDARGNGQYLAEVAMQRYGSGRIDQVMFTPEWYRDNMPKYKAAFEDGMLLLPMDDDVLNDHRAIRMERGIARIPDNARTKGADNKKRHGDSAIAGALFYAASLADVALYECETIARSHTADAPALGRTPQHDALDDMGVLAGRGAY